MTREIIGHEEIVVKGGIEGDAHVDRLGERTSLGIVGRPVDVIATHTAGTVGREIESRAVGHQDRRFVIPSAIQSAELAHLTPSANELLHLHETEVAGVIGNGEIGGVATLSHVHQPIGVNIRLKEETVEADPATLLARPVAFRLLAYRQSALGGHADTENLTGYLHGALALLVIAFGESEKRVILAYGDELGISRPRLLIFALDLIRPADIQIGLGLEEAAHLGGLQSAQGIVRVNTRHGLGSPEIIIDLGITLIVSRYGGESHTCAGIVTLRKE